MMYTLNLLPLAAVVSLVWTATRYESTTTILRKSLRLFVQILFFMALILFGLYMLSRGL
jgi:hypothetical protein